MTCHRGHELDPAGVCVVCAPLDAAGKAAEAEKRRREIESDLPPVLRRLPLRPPHKKQEFRER